MIGTTERWGIAAGRTLPLHIWANSKGRLRGKGNGDFREGRPPSPPSRVKGSHVPFTKEMYEFWDRQLRPLGYKLKVQIIDFPRDAGRYRHHPEMDVSRSGD